MKCVHCGKSPMTHNIVLIRQNEKGVPGIFACESCNTLPVDNLVEEFTSIIQAENEKTRH